MIFLFSKKKLSDKFVKYFFIKFSFCFPPPLVLLFDLGGRFLLFLGEEGGLRVEDTLCVMLFSFVFSISTVGSPGPKFNVSLLLTPDT